MLSLIMYVESELQAADIFTKTFESGVKWVTLLPLINVSMPEEFWALVHSLRSVFVAAVVQHTNFPWDRRVLDRCIANDCVWEGDIVFDFTRPSHWDTHIPPLERGYGSCQHSGIIDDLIHQLSLHLNQCRDANELIMRTLVRHPKSRKLAWFHRVERGIDSSEHSLVIAGIAAIIDLFVEHKCGVVIECPLDSTFWPDHLAPHFIDRGFHALGYDWSNHSRTVTGIRNQLDMFLLVDPLVLSAVGPDCSEIGTYPLLLRWFGSHVSF